MNNVELGIVMTIKNSGSVLECGRMYQFPFDIYLLHAYATRKDRGRIMAQLSLLDIDFDISVFKIFLAKFDEEGILNECYGLVTETMYPDDFVFKIL